MIKFKTTEKSVRLIEAENKIVIEVARNSKKDKLKKSIEDMFKVKVESINTLIHGNRKYAYIKLNKKNPAIDIATKFGVI